MGVWDVLKVGKILMVAGGSTQMFPRARQQGLGSAALGLHLDILSLTHAWR